MTEPSSVALRQLPPARIHLPCSDRAGCGLYSGAWLCLGAEKFGIREAGAGIGPFGAGVADGYPDLRGSVDNARVSPGSARQCGGYPGSGKASNARR